MSAVKDFTLGGLSRPERNRSFLAPFLRPDVYAKDVLDDGSEFEVVCTPVVVRVGEVHKGRLREGTEVVLRSMGGTAGGVRYETEEAPAKKTFTKGASLVVFGSAHETVDSETAPGHDAQLPLPGDRATPSSTPPTRTARTTAVRPTG